MLEKGNREWDDRTIPDSTLEFTPVQQLSPQLDVDTFVAIYNPESRDAQRVVRRLGALASLGITVDEIHTVRGGAYPNAEKLFANRHLLGPQTGAFIIGGDGTGHAVHNALKIAGQHEPSIDHTRRIFPGGGSTGDTAKALNAPHALARIDQMLRTGWFVDVYPLRMTIDDPSNTVPEVVEPMSYGSIGGFTGLAAQYIDAKPRQLLRNRLTPTRRLSQGLTGLQAYRDAELVTMSIDGEQPRKTLDVHFLSGPIMASLKHRSKELTTPGFHMVENEKRSLGYLVSRALMLGAGRLIDKNTPVSNHMHVEIYDDAIIQADGETWRVPAGTSLTIEPGDPFKALTTRPELRTT